MSITLDDLELVAREEGGPGEVNEFRTVNRIVLNGKRRLVEHRTAGAEGSVFDDTGRRAAVIALEGEMVGKTARTTLASLKTKYDASEPVSFSSDISTLASISQVVVERLSIRQLAGKVDHYEFAVTLKEYVPADSQDSSPLSQAEAASAAVDAAATGDLE